jgi:hypothetical protein
VASAVILDFQYLYLLKYRSEVQDNRLDIKEHSHALTMKGYACGFYSKVFS